MDLAPVIVSVYDRLSHLRNCIDSLKAGPVSGSTDLYVVSDAAHSPQFEPAIEAVRTYVRGIAGFKSVIPIEREKNLGSFRSINSAIDLVLEKHGKVIFLEDDNVVSENFLQFMNDCLDYYRDDPTLFSVSGSNYPIVIPKSYRFDVYKWQGFNAWGAGLWRDKWKRLDWSLEGLRRFLADRTRVKALGRVSELALWHLREAAERGRLITDGVITMNLVSTNMYSLFPVISKVRNLGLDGSGEHCGVGSAAFSDQEIDSGSDYRLPKDLSPSDDINRVLSSHFRVSLKRKIGRRIPEAIKKPIRRMGA